LAALDRVGKRLGSEDDRQQAVLDAADWFTAQARGQEPGAWSQGLEEDVQDELWQHILHSKR